MITVKRPSLEAGADFAIITRWITETESGRVAAEADLALPVINNSGHHRR
ncbi:hypothetical protein [Spirillospora sp. CA-294931]